MLLSVLWFSNMVVLPIPILLIYSIDSCSLLFILVLVEAFSVLVFLWVIRPFGVVCEDALSISVFSFILLFNPDMWFWTCISSSGVLESSVCEALGLPLSIICLFIVFGLLI
ncbi:unnamed protein product (mitochondrion) [Enteromyxum leei]|uniref:Uncharacterized protein n=1 Tax=Enteromyxum leei TaxID=188704 RepID=A0A1Q2XC96_ENTLE|nr:unnamed protein product [Enteromyxum leei]